MARQESRRERKIRAVTHSPEAAERPWSELLEAGRTPTPPETGPRSAADELWDEEAEAPEPENER